ncbi:MAG: hypothetical protein ACK4TA_23000 [Saprospiraceae bacterium]
MKTTFTFAFLLLAYSTIFAQVLLDIQGLNDVSPYNRGAKGFDLRYEGVRGTPLLFDDWQTAKIQLADRDTFGATAKINVDLEQNLLILQLPGEKVGQVSPYKLKAFKIEDAASRQTQLWTVLREKEVEGTTNSQEKFYELLHQGKFTLLKSVKKTFKRANYKEAYSIGARYDEYIKGVDYWLREGDKPFQEIKLKRKSLDEVLSRYASRMERIIKNQKLNVSEEKDVIKLLTALEEDN